MNRTLSSLARPALLVLAGASLALPVALSASPVPPPPPLPEPAAGFPARTLDAATGIAADAVQTATGTATPIVTRTTETAERAVERTVERTVEQVDRSVRTATGIVDEALEGQVSACPGVPVSAGVSLRPRDLLVVRVPLALRSPSAALGAAGSTLNGISVALPQPGTLLSQPIRVSAEASVPDPQPVMAGARTDVGTATAALPSLEVGIGTERTTVTASTWVHTVLGGGGLTFVLADPGSEECSTVAWSIRR